jgi:tetratricopeptide (TPR) repeat protein
VLHARLVQTIHRLYADRLPEQVERLAHHALRGELWDEAAGALRQAGTKAAERSANHEAVLFFEQALIALSHLPPTREVLEQAVDVRFELRHSLLLLAEFDRIRDHLREAENLATSLGDERRLGRIHAYLSNYHNNAGEPEPAIEYARRALAAAEALDDLGLEVLSASTWDASPARWEGSDKPASSSGRTWLGSMAVRLSPGSELPLRHLSSRCATWYRPSPNWVSSPRGWSLASCWPAAAIPRLTHTARCWCASDSGTSTS